VLKGQRASAHGVGYRIASSGPCSSPASFDLGSSTPRWAMPSGEVQSRMTTIAGSAGGAVWGATMAGRLAVVSRRAMGEPRPDAGAV